MGDGPLIVVLWDQEGVEYRVPRSVLEQHAGRLVWPGYARSHVVTAYFLDAAVRLVEAARRAMHLHPSRTEAFPGEQELQKTSDEVVELLPPGYVRMPQGNAEGRVSEGALGSVSYPRDTPPDLRAAAQELCDAQMALWREGTAENAARFCRAMDALRAALGEEQAV